MFRTIALVAVITATFSLAVPASAVDVEPLPSGADYIAAADAGTIDELAATATVSETVEGVTTDGLYPLADGISADEDVAQDLFVLQADLLDPSLNTQREPTPLAQEELYGDAVSVETLQSFVPLLVEQESEAAGVNTQGFVLDAPQAVADAFGVQVGALWKFTWGNSGRGYIVLGTHTREPVILDFRTTRKFAGSRAIYLLGDHAVYVDTNVIVGPTGAVISASNFADLLAQRRSASLNMSRDDLRVIEQQSRIQLNNLTSLVSTDEINAWYGTNFDGQEEQGTIANYGQIFDISAYLADRYKASGISVKESRVLPISMFVQNSYGGARDCAPIAITRVFKYYRDYKSFTAMPSTTQALYDAVVVKARDHGFTNEHGTNPVNIDDIMRSVASKYSYGSKARGIYLWKFSTSIKSEITNGRPVIMSIKQGSYKNHTLTINGYKVYKYTVQSAYGPYTETRVFLAVVDSWTANQRYIDLDEMLLGGIHGSVSSLNVMTLTK